MSNTKLDAVAREEQIVRGDGSGALLSRPLPLHHTTERLSQKGKRPDDSVPV
jgi:hypothetical protein